MQTVNIRQLKSNRSAALVPARQEDVAIVPSRDRPQSMLVNLEGLGLPNLSDVGVVLPVRCRGCLGSEPLEERDHFLPYSRKNGRQTVGRNADDSVQSEYSSDQHSQKKH